MALLANPGAAAAERGFGLGALDEERQLEDVLLLRILGREIVALDGLGGGVRKLRLDSGESVQWSGARGRIGVVLTDRRALGVRQGSGWRELRLRLAEVLPPRVEVGDRVALLVTSKRILAFDGNWSQQDLGPTELLEAARVGSGAVLVVTNRRAFGLSSSSNGFLATPLHLHERIESAHAGAGLAEVTTSKRVLLFSGRSGVWSEERRTLR